MSFQNLFLIQNFDRTVRTFNELSWCKFEDSFFVILSSKIEALGKFARYYVLYSFFLRLEEGLLTEFGRAWKFTCKIRILNFSYMIFGIIEIFEVLVRKYILLWNHIITLRFCDNNHSRSLSQMSKQLKWMNKIGTYQYDALHIKIFTKSTPWNMVHNAWTKMSSIVFQIL